ncbi:hypothetical protein BDZ90DRAFT_180519 [Jaminaea rosea]|uniref:Uncharacterized protein n=1 Tax=Jaminaea rosea TaxID=1569628 RepID=A0A316UQA9_9BASI|nr:hypothetical protein BDZ90DRAFT_180519 [Jaminaea rosea]PWN27487.1 hypothetical protein BDZ90DRAFT_180519 [Jaminaea rosea]
MSSARWSRWRLCRPSSQRTVTKRRHLLNHDQHPSIASARMVKNSQQQLLEFWFCYGRIVATQDQDSLLLYELKRYVFLTIISTILTGSLVPMTILYAPGELQVLSISIQPRLSRIGAVDAAAASLSLHHLGTFVTRHRSCHHLAGSPLAHERRCQLCSPPTPGLASLAASAAASNPAGSRGSPLREPSCPWRKSSRTYGTTLSRGSGNVDALRADKSIEQGLNLSRS